MDGHNRFEFCAELGISFTVDTVECESRQWAKIWIRRNQLGRRNLPDDARAMTAAWLLTDLKKLALTERGKQARRAVKTRHPMKPDMSGDVTDKSGKQGKKAKKDNLVAIAKESKVSQWRVRQALALEKRAVALLGEDAAERVCDEVGQGQTSIAKANRALAKIEAEKNLNSIEALQAKEAAGTYDVFVIDPPWPMDKIERDTRPEQVSFDYPVMTIDEIRAEVEKMPDEHAEPDAHVFLWTTQKFLPLAFGLIEHWNLAYGETFTWHKPGGFQPFGGPQYNSEFVVHARMGSPNFLDTRDFPTCFNAPRGDHSEKPEEFYKTLRRVTGGRRLDMYNRREIEGFDGWGKEAKAPRTRQVL